MNGKVKIKFWKVGNGDAFTSTYCNTKNEIKNLFIDGGHRGNYLHTIKKEILDIQSTDRHIDIWIKQNFPSFCVSGYLGSIPNCRKNKPTPFKMFLFETSKAPPCFLLLRRCGWQSQ